MANAPEIISEDFDLRDAILAHAKALRTILGSNNELVIQNTSEKYPVRMSIIQLEQVLSALASNAHDAMPDGGTFSIHFETLTMDEDKAKRVTLWKGPHVLMTVQDTGVGMSEAVLKNVFEPFFTTKPGRTGLGTASVYGIIKCSAGEIVCSSVVGAGTEFKIYFPLRPWAGS